MSWITDILGRIFPRRESQQEGGNYPVLGSTGKPLNHLYNPRPKKDDFDECDAELDRDMRARGYRKYLTGDDIPRPRRRFLKKSEKMEVGDTKVMAGVSHFKEK